MSQSAGEPITMLDRAIALLRRGWPMVPSRGSYKRPCVKWKRYQKELPTIEDLRNWKLEFHPERWGLVTGALSGIVVVDFDGDIGRECMIRWGITDPHVKTGSGGRHLYLKHPGWPVPTLNARIARQWPWPGVDIRGDGGFAVLLGHNKNGPYELLRSLDPEPWEVLPPELREYLLRHSQRMKTETLPVPASGGRVDIHLLLRRALDQASVSGRNNAGMWLACQLRDNAYSQSETASAMQEYQLRVPATSPKGEREPYTKAEVAATLKEVFGRPAREPWSSGMIRPVPGAPPSRQDPRAPERQASVLPQIQANNRRFRDLCAEALQALRMMNVPPALFAQTNRLVCVEAGQGGRQLITEVHENKLRLFLAQAADFYEAGVRGRRDIPPPLDVVRGVLAESPGRWGFPVLEALLEAPTLRRDGSINMTNGYDPSSGLYLAPTAEFDNFHIAEEPVSADLKVALDRIRDVIGEFPFVDQASFANVLATMLTAVCRHILDGPTPLALFDATTAGTGKTLLAEVISLIVAGRPAELFTAPREPEEWRKQLTSVLREGPGVVIIDNVGTRLDSPELCKVLTADVHSDRLLGKSQTVSLPVRCSWIATGNNLRLGGDIPRRCYWIRMEAPCSEPFKRTGFRHPHLKTYVLKQRVQLLGALLTLARGWFVAGRPSATIAPLGSYEHWTEVVGGILQHAGVDGFLGNIEQLYQQADTESAAWETFLLTLHAVFASQPFTVAELWDKLNERTTDLTTSLSRSANELRAALPSELMRWIDQQGPFKQRLGMAFSERRGRRFGKSQIRIEQGTQDTHAKVASWSVLAGS